MKVSIITVCFNSEKTIEATILSVFNQSYHNIEYIIVDGNSTDKTIAIISKHGTKISSWISEYDKGLYHAMNKGICMSSGDLIGILNSDDIFVSNSVIDKIVGFHKNYDIDASIGNVIQYNAKGDLMRVYSSKNWLPNKLRFGYMPPHPSIFFKRELFENFGMYDIGFDIAADYELIIRFFLKKKITWKYSGITTTSMLVGGISSSGFNSYRKITKEIQKALTLNNVNYSVAILRLRFFWKINEFLLAKMKRLFIFN